MLQLVFSCLPGAVLSHILFHFFYPTSISIPFILSVTLAALTVLFQYSTFGLQRASDVAFILGVYPFALLLSITLYRLSPFHPLAGYPGPTLAKVTKLWGVWNAWTGRQHRVFLQLHRMYGPIVRTGPNEISVVDVNAVTDVLGAGGAPKGEFYNMRKDPSAPNNLLAMTGEAHDNRRRLWNRGMGQDSLNELETVVARRGKELVDRLKCESRQGTGISGGTVDIVRWIDYFAFDFMGDMAFGGGFNMLAEGDDRRGLWNLLKAFVHLTHVGAHIPWAIPAFMKCSLYSRHINAYRKLGLDFATARLKAGASAKDLWYHLSDEAELEKTRPSMRDVVADGALAMVAGADTTAAALAGFFYYVLHDGRCYQRLREEIDSVCPPGSEVMDKSRHKQLVWLNACINETLRLAPPLPTNGPRQVPYTSQGVMVAGQFIPPGTQVYVPPYVMHRDPRYFSPSPDSFDPSRWLSSPDCEAASVPTKGEETTLNKLAFIPFSYGPANCVGKQLALLEMGTVICALMQTFDFALPDSGAEAGGGGGDWLDSIRDYLVTERGPLWVKVMERMA